MLGIEQPNSPFPEQMLAKSIDSNCMRPQRIEMFCLPQTFIGYTHTTTFILQLVIYQSIRVI